MNPAIPGTLAVLAYLVGTGFQFASLTRSMAHGRMIVLATASFAVSCHALSVYAELHRGGGINLGLSPMLSLMGVSISALVVLNSFRRQVENLFVAVFPFAALSLAVGFLTDSGYQPRSDIDAGIVTHIVLSVVAYSLLTIAALQAALLSFGDYELRTHRTSLLDRLPPLQTMEALLFETLWAGLTFLTLSIGSGFAFLEDIHRPGLIHHTVITLVAWVVFAILLWGRFRLGWRGAVASRWVLTGFVILAVGYFGSKLVLEVILGRG